MSKHSSRRRGFQSSYRRKSSRSSLGIKGGSVLLILAAVLALALALPFGLGCCLSPPVPTPAPSMPVPAPDPATAPTTASGGDIAVYGAASLTDAETLCLIIDADLNLAGFNLCFVLPPEEYEFLDGVPSACPSSYAGAIVFSQDFPVPVLAALAGASRPIGLAWSDRKVAVVFVNEITPRLPWAVANVAMHEYGHLLGLEHTRDCAYIGDCLDCSDCMAGHVTFREFLGPCTFSGGVAEE